MPIKLRWVGSRRVGALFFVAALVQAWAGPALGQLVPAPKPAPPATAPAPETTAPKAPAEQVRPVRVEFTPIGRAEIVGTGPVAMILVHDVGTDWRSFKAFMERNRERYTMHAVSLPGYSGTAAPAEPPRGRGWLSDAPWLANAQAAILAYMTEHKIEKAVIVGHGVGGRIAVRMALDSPGRVIKAISIDGSPGSSLPQAWELSDEQRDAMTTRMHVQMSRAPKERLEALQRSAMARDVRSAARADELLTWAEGITQAVRLRYTSEQLADDIVLRLEALQTPVLFIAALPEADSTPGERQNSRGLWERMLEHKVNTEIVFFENTRHFVMEDSPGELDRAIEEYVAGKKVSGRTKFAPVLKVPPPCEPAPTPGVDVPGADAANPPGPGDKGNGKDKPESSGS